MSASPRTRRGFSLVEVMIALAVLTIVLAGLGRFIGTFVHGVRTSTTRTMATEVARARLATVETDPRYTMLTALYGGTAPGADVTGFPGFPAMRRQTFVSRDQSGTPPRDITTITVRVTDPSIPQDTISLTTMRARP
ncbi:MAG TPA: prepilin-type N-terminal cleavage/methylation domain-containing protein [Gemmatimonadales bacterium]|nr:prepilin-type N-terminal cleavage/methylation domain-containing protein [Gemmatimonadales bacterium]